MSAALEGYRILDLTHVLAGPFCCYQLGVLGAQVIKLEPPQQPDMMRAEGPDTELAQQHMGLHYQSQNAGKLAMSLDISCDAGREVFNRLVATADVLVTNYRRVSQQRLGLDWQTLAQVNPRLITCSITGFGHTGPKANDAAYDNVIQAFSGLLSATGHAEGEPVKVGPPVLDYGTGAQAALAVTAALLLRERTGEVTHPDVAMLDAALMLMTSSVTEAAYTGAAPKPHGNSNPARAGYGCYETADGKLMIGAFTSRQNAMLWRVLGDDSTANEVGALLPAELDARFRQDRQALQCLFMERTATEWEAELNQSGVPASRVRTLDEALADNQVQSRSVLQQVPQPAAQQTALQGVDGTSLAIGSQGPVTTFASKAWNTSDSDTPDCLTTLPPAVGQHNDKLLTELGFAASEITALKQAGVI